VIAFLTDILYALRLRWRRWRNPPLPITQAQMDRFQHEKRIEPWQRMFLIALYRWNQGIPAPPSLTIFGVHGPDGGEPDHMVWPAHLVPLSPSLSAACREIGFYRLGRSVLPALSEIAGSEVPEGVLTSFYNAIKASIPAYAETAHNQHKEARRNLNLSLSGAVSVEQICATHDCGGMFPVTAADGTQAVTTYPHDPLPLYTANRPRTSK
jgi:hypothetical protein